MIERTLENALNTAFTEAQRRHHVYLTLEHLLYAISMTEEGIDILTGAGVDIEEMQQDILEYMENIETVMEGLSEPLQTIAFQRILQKALVHVHSSEKKEMDMGDVLVALFDEEDSYARYFFEKQHVEKIDVLNYVSHGLSREDYASFDDEEYDELDDGEDFEPVSKQAGKLLESFTEDMTALAAEGRYDALIGRKVELERTMEILSRRQKNNALHVGEPGVGKTAITQGLAQNIVHGRVPERLKDYRVYALDMGSMVAGTRFRGDFEERLKGLFKEFKKQGKVIVFIDEIHTIVGAGSVNGGSMDASNLLKPLITSGEVRVIGATTHDEYRQYFQKDRALARRFQKVDVPEPTLEETLAVLKGLRSRYEEYHNVRYSDKALRSAVDLSARFIADRFLPDKAIDVIDEAAAAVTLHHPNRRVVSLADIERQVARMARIPLRNITGREKASLADLSERLEARVYGQGHAVQSVVKAVRRHRAGLGAEQKPIGSFLFAGPTGVGKTELARALADELSFELIRFDMSEYMEKHSISRLLGSPPGYVGFDQGAQLTDSIRRHPRAVLLLDEIEKAHPDLFNSLLQIMDYATVTDATGLKADFRNVVLIMTSNAGSHEMSSNKIGFLPDGKERKGDPKAAIKKVFSPEFINRLDEVVVFHHLSRENIFGIVRKFVAQIEDQLRSKKIKINIDEAALAYLAEKGYHPEYGAREMSRILQEKIKDPLVDEILFGRLEKGGEITVSMKDDEIVFV